MAIAVIDPPLCQSEWTDYSVLPNANKCHHEDTPGVGPGRCFKTMTLLPKGYNLGFPWNRLRGKFSENLFDKYFFFNIPGTASWCSLQPLLRRYWGTSLCWLGGGSRQPLSENRKQGLCNTLVDYTSVETIPASLVRLGLLLGLPKER